jgi:hypothetical protein
MAWRLRCRLAMRPVRDLATALLATHLVGCSAHAGIEVSCRPTEGGANARDASACASLPPTIIYDSRNCTGDGVPAACVVGQTYACVAPPPLYPPPGDAGSLTGPPAACVVGKTLCRRFQATGVGVSSTVECADVPAACANNPTCACLCGSVYHCYSECSCVESGGFATITCMQV